MSRQFDVAYDRFIRGRHWRAWDIVDGQRITVFAPYFGDNRRELADRMKIDISYIPNGAKSFKKRITVPDSLD